MRTVNTAASAILAAGGTLPLSLLVDMPDLSSPLRLCTGRWSLTWASLNYIAVGQLGTVEPAQESASGPKPINFKLTGVPASFRSLALQENVQGKSVSILLAIFDPVTYEIADAVPEWQGTLDVMDWADDGSTGVISVSAESAGVDLLRGVSVRYTDQDQQRLFLGDKGLEYVVAQGDKSITWPAASYYQR
jgi:hypothetical protein